MQLFQIRFDKEKKEILDKKLSALIDNHSLMITKLNYNCPGFMEIKGSVNVLKIIVEFIQSIAGIKRTEADAEKAKAEAEKAKAEAERARAEAEKARAEAGKARAEEERAQAEAGKARAEEEKVRAEIAKMKIETENINLNRQLALSKEKISQVYTTVANLESIRELLFPLSVEEEEYPDILVNLIANLLEPLQKHIESKRITSAELI